MPSVYQISGFSNQLYLKGSGVNQHDLLHVEMDWRKIKGDGWIETTILSGNQTTEFLNQLYFGIQV